MFIKSFFFKLPKFVKLSVWGIIVTSNPSLNILEIVSETPFKQIDPLSIKYFLKMCAILTFTNQVASLTFYY